MPEISPAPVVSEADKPFAEWLGKLLAAEAPEGVTPLQSRLRDLHQKQQQLLARIRQAEGELSQARSMAVRQEGAAEQIVELLREEFEAKQKPGESTGGGEAPSA